MREERPADECPFGRPLPEGFDDCRLFHPVRFVPLNAYFEALQPVLTCRHMEIGQVVRGDRAGAYYVRCAFGDAQARAATAARVDERRGRLMRELADGIMEVVLAHWETLGTVKGAELAARSEPERQLARREVHATSQFIASEMRQVATGRFGQHLAELGIRPEAMEAVIDAGVRDFEANGFAAWTPPAELLAQLPPDVAAFLAAPSPQNSRQAS